MATSMWAKAVEAIRPRVVLIETPSARGTGFVIHPPSGTGDPYVVTAWHVVQHADQWREPIRVTHFSSSKQAFLDANSRIVSANQTRDIAFLQFSTSDMPFPHDPAPLLGINTRLVEGVEVGWLGYPAVAPSALCFFCGHISAWLQQDEAYLVDGVAINGVSGGPAFAQDDNEAPVMIGLVTEYRPNYATGTPLPGVSLVRSINPLVQHYDKLQKQIEKAKVQDIPPMQT